MLRNFIFSVCLLSATGALAQQGKITEKQPAAEIDYKLIGAPMPPLVYVTLHDTATKKETTTPAEERSSGKKRNRKKTEEAQPAGDMQLHVMTNKDLDNGANLFVMMFNPTCSHCEEETVLIEKNISLFKRSKVALIANKRMQPYLPDFIRTLHITDYPPIYVGVDSMTFIGDVFLYSALPQINIYDGHRKLLKTYTGEVAIDSLKQYIQ
ncbi:MAG: hypothetical protein JWQ38_1464 [Flavipsychrobacter sp.]|nr:hypothetical protein [Flavipsychrobacter sp.]